MPTKIDGGPNNQEITSNMQEHLLVVLFSPGDLLVESHLLATTSA